MEYKVEISYKKVKYLRMKVKDGTVKVTAPFLTSKEYIEKFIASNTTFIKKQMLKYESKLAKTTFSFNDEITILNKKYIILKGIRNKINGNYIFIKEDLDIAKQIKKLFKNQLLELLSSLSLSYYQKMNIDVLFPKIVIKDVKSKWGSYSKSKNEIIYSSNLLFKDSIVYNYIVVHELSHMLEYNHSKKFYEIVEKYCPNYKKIRKMLKEW